MTMTTVTTPTTRPTLATVACPRCDKMLARDLAGSVVLYCRRCKTEVGVSYTAGGRLVIGILTQKLDL